MVALLPNTYGSDQSFAWAIDLPRASRLYIGSPPLSSLYQKTMLTTSLLLTGSMSQGIWALKPATADTSSIGTEKLPEILFVQTRRRLQRNTRLKVIFSKAACIRISNGSFINDAFNDFQVMAIALKAVTLSSPENSYPCTQWDFNDPLCLMFFNSFVPRFKLEAEGRWRVRPLCRCCFHSVIGDDLVLVICRSLRRWGEDVITQGGKK